MKKNSMFNASRCKDMTAYEALNNIDREEQELNQRVNKLITALKDVIDLSGFDLLARIEVRDKKTGRDFR